MKKYILALIASVAISQSMYAAQPPLAESLSEYEAIVSALSFNPDFQGIISVDESIIDIKRITKEVNTPGTIKYKIVTRIGETVTLARRSRHCHNGNTKTYIATLLVTPNPDIGPLIIEVVSIVPITH